MIRNLHLYNSIRFILLVLGQVLVFNHLDIFGYVNPMVYPLFLYWYPTKGNQTTFLAISFALGMAVDIFSDTAALHTAATVTAAYLRPIVMRFCFGGNYEFQNFKLSMATQLQRSFFMALLLLVHHLVFFGLEIFSLTNLVLILQQSTITFCASLILCLLLGSLFSAARK